MNPLIQQKKTTALFLIIFALGYSAFLSKTHAVVPPPDGGYPGGNTAEGHNALLNLTTGGFNTAVGWLALRSNTQGDFNTATGAGALVSNTIADQNTATGTGALLSNTTGSFNTAMGVLALFQNTTASFNVAVGDHALANSTGSENTAIGRAALFHNTSGSQNIALGISAGLNLTTGDNNIDIGNAGEAGDSDTIRIGATQDRTFIAGIRATQPPVGVILPVLIDFNGQLGTTVSSRRFKHEIKPMDKASETILALKPVTFHYKSDDTETPQYGLIAEEVAEANPDLVVRDKDGEIYTVRYDAVNAMLLNEFLKEHKTVQELKATLGQQQKEIAALIGHIKEQDAKIQRVSDQLAMSNSVPQVASTN
jgi:Chaperone of endosialidase